MRSGWRMTLYGVLGLVCIVALAAPVYNRLTPSLFGLPFFVWFQMAWVIVAAVATGLALRAAKGRH